MKAYTNLDEEGEYIHYQDFGVQIPRHLLPNISSWVKETTPDEKKNSIKATLQAVQHLFTKSKGDSDRAQPVVNRAQHVANRAQHVAQLAVFSSKQVSAAIDAGQSLFTQDMDEFYKLDILETLTPLSDSEKATLIKAAHLLLEFTKGSSGGMENTKRKTRIQELLPYSVDNISEARGASKPLFTDNMSAGGKAAIVLALAPLTPQEKINAVEAALPYLTADMTGYAKATIIETMAALSKDERAAATQAAQPLFTPNMTGDEKVWLIRTLASVDDRTATVQVVHPLLTEDMSVFEKAALIKAVALLSADSRVATVQAALPYFTMWGNDEEIIEALAPFSAEEITTATQDAQPLFTQDMPGNEKVEIIKVLAPLPPDNRTAIVDAIQPLFTQGMRGREWAKIIAHFVPLSPEQRATIVQNVRLLASFDGPIADYAIADFIEAWIPLSVNERIAATEAARPLFPGFMSVNCKLMIIAALAPLSANERIATIQALHSLSVDFHRHEVIKCLALLSADSKIAIVETADLFFTEDTEDYDKLCIIKALCPFFGALDI